MRRFLTVVAQLALLGLFDWIYFINDFSGYTAKQWWAFALLHAAILVEFVALFVLRRMKAMPISKKHPIVVFTVYFVIQLVLAIVFTLVNKIELKYVIIFEATVLVLELLAFGTLYLMQRHRDKKSGNVTEKPKKKHESVVEDDDEDETEEEAVETVEEEEPAPIKVKSSAMLLLLQFLADPAKWNVPEELSKDIDILTQIASNASQHSYDVLGGIEVQLKTQTDALKSYVGNQSIDRAKATVRKIIEILNERENQIDEIEQN